MRMTGQLARNNEARISGKKAAGLLGRAAVVLATAGLLAACGATQRAATPQFGTGPTGPVVGPVQTAAPNVDGQVTVAILLPLSGPDASLGQTMLNAAQMAAVETGGQNFVLIAKDTGGTPTGATAAAQAAIAERADLIVGPLRAESVAAVGPIAASAGINVIGFTSDTSVAGPNVFVMGYTPEEQVDRILAYTARQGTSVVAALVPNSRYGSVAMSAMQASAGRYGVGVGTVQTYDQSQPDHRASVEPLQSGGFDALMIPDSGGSLQRILAFVGYYNINTQAQILGTSTWYDSSTLSEPASVGAIFAGVDTTLLANFEAKYSGAYGGQPPLVAGLAYDAVGLAASLGRNPEEQAFDRNNIANPNGFGGVLGAFRFGGNGVAEHGLAVLRVEQNGFSVIDPAPGSFIGF